MRLYLVRHADAASGNPDDLRPLTDRGRAQARDVAAVLVRETPVDAVVSSPLLRARETAAEIARAAGVDAEVDAALAPGATAAGVRSAVRGRGETVVAVGHQPDCSEIAAALGAGEQPFPPAGWVALDL